MSYRNRKFWETVMNNIDSELADHAAERMTRVGGVKTEDIPEEGGEAVEIKPTGKGKSRLPVYLAIGAAAAAVAVTVGLTIKERTPVPISDNSASSESGDTVEIEWTTDLALFEEYFMARWENPDYEYKGENTDPPFLELDYGGDFGNICLGEQARFHETDKGCYMLTGGDNPQLYFVNKDKTELIDQTEDSDGVRYVRAGEAELPLTLGSLGILKISEQTGIPLESLSGCEFTDSAGRTWLRNGNAPTDGGNILVWSAENSFVASMPFHTEDENGNVSETGYFKVTFTQSGDEWAIWHAYEYDIRFNNRKAFDVIPEDVYFDSAIFEQVFAGEWRGRVSNSDVTTETVLNLDYHSDLTQSYAPFERYDRCYQGKDGWFMEGFSGGAGQLLFVPNDDPETMYYYMDIDSTTALAEPDVVYRRTAYPSCSDLALYGKLNALGAKQLNLYLEQNEEGFAQALEQAATFEDEEGEWTYADIATSSRIAPRNIFLLELSEERIQLGVPFVAAGERYDEFGMQFSKFQVLVFEKQNGEWRFTERKSDIRVDNTAITIPEDEPVLYFSPYTEGWVTAEEIESEIEWLESTFLTENQLDNMEYTDINGKVWIRGGNGAPYPIYRICDITDSRIVVSAPFGYDDGSLGAIFRVVFEPDESGSWKMTGVEYCDLSALSGYVPTVQEPLDYQFNDEIFKARFGGRWYTDSYDENDPYPFMMNFDCITEDCGINMAYRFGNFFEDENGWYFGTQTGYAGASLVEGSGLVFFIPRSDPEVMYAYSDWNPEKEYTDYDKVYLHESLPDSADFNLVNPRDGIQHAVYGSSYVNSFGELLLEREIRNRPYITDGFFQAAKITVDGEGWTRDSDYYAEVYRLDDYAFDMTSLYSHATENGETEYKSFRVRYTNKLYSETLEIVNNAVEKKYDENGDPVYVNVDFFDEWKSESDTLVIEYGADFDVVSTFLVDNGYCMYIFDERMNTDGVLYYIQSDDPDTMYAWYNCRGTTPRLCEFDEVFHRQ